jgi:hypothetical protein
MKTFNPNEFTEITIGCSNRYCSCPDWESGIEKINGPIILDQVRTGNYVDENYFKKFVYCPWCGEKVRE